MSIFYKRWKIFFDRVLGLFLYSKFKYQREYSKLVIKEKVV